MAGITFIRRDQNDGVNIVRIVAENTLAEVGTAGYLLAQNDNIVALNHGTFDWLATDMVLVAASDGWGFFNPSTDFESLVPFIIVPGVTTPTIVGHIAVYDSTGGNIGEDAATAINGGNIQAGLSGTAGYLASFPGTAARGSLRLVAANNAGNTVTQITNASFGQASVLTIPDPGAATANFLLAPAALVSGNLNQSSGTAGLVADSGIAAINVSMTKVFTLTEAQLASAGKVNIQVHPSGTSQYFIQDVKVLKSTGLSGGGGDRLLAITDGTLVFNNAGITAALLGTPIFTLWGGTGNPISNSASDISTAGADIYFQYTGGTTDYTTGSVQVAVTYVKVTA